MNSTAPKVHPFFAILSGILEVSSAIFVISSFMLQQLTYFCDFVDFINYFFYFITHCQDFAQSFLGFAQQFLSSSTFSQIFGDHRWGAYETRGAGGGTCEYGDGAVGMGGYSAHATAAARGVGCYSAHDTMHPAIGWLVRVIRPLVYHLRC
jgi:hypothetical protein